MNPGRLELRPLSPEDEPSFKRAVAAFSADSSSFNFAFNYEPDASFEDYIRMLEGWPIGIGLPEKFVRNTFLVGAVDGEIVGRSSIRHELNDFLRRLGGHIGFGVVPGYRQMGYAKEILRQSLQFCSNLGLEKVLVTCDDDNRASARVIEACGGILENVVAVPEQSTPVRRYWLATVPDD